MWRSRQCQSPSLGSVVISVQMMKVGKHTDPEVMVRFKICKAGSTDWVGWILGARALDCPAKGALGFVLLDHSHSFSELGILTERTERPAKPRLDNCYPIRVSSMDNEVGRNEIIGGRNQVR